MNTLIRSFTEGSEEDEPDSSDLGRLFESMDGCSLGEEDESTSFVYLEHVEFCTQWK